MILSAENMALAASCAGHRTPVSGWTHNFYRYPCTFLATVRRGRHR